MYELYGIHYTPEKAVDGSHNTDGLKPPYFAHTQDSMWAELNPWWQASQQSSHPGLQSKSSQLVALE